MDDDGFYYPEGYAPSDNLYRRTDVAIVIPVREESTRLPSKCFLFLENKLMIKYVYDKVRAYGYPTFVATDSEKVQKLIGENTIMTPHCCHGTDRVMRTNLLGTYEKVVNVQGDNPDVTLDIVERIIAALDNEYVVNGYKKCDSARQSQVGVRLKGDHIVNYSRDTQEKGYVATGFHGYHRVAKYIYQNSKPSWRESDYGVEQFRWLDNGVRIQGVDLGDWDGIEINTQADYNEWKQRRKNNE